MCVDLAFSELVKSLEEIFVEQNEELFYCVKMAYNFRVRFLLAVTDFSGIRNFSLNSQEASMY